jgi:hypothetical protein
LQVNSGSSRALAGLSIALMLVAPAWAADQTVRGRQLVVADLDPVGSGRRVILASAAEPNSPNTITGDPTAAGSVALLEVIADGAHASAQVFALPQGTGRGGRPFWRSLGRSGFAYRDARMPSIPSNRRRCRCRSAPTRGGRPPSSATVSTTSHSIHSTR